MSSPIQPSGTSTPSSACVSVSAANALPGDEVDGQPELVAAGASTLRAGSSALLLAQ